jgi:NADH:ubiquinone oxidoreductase subunit 5 (subunit L)/multisubunit Na+/H+ antiporter MnhA subunit
MSFRYYVQNIHELPKNMGFSLFILSFGSIFSGYFLKDLFVGFGNNFFGNSIYKTILYNTSIDIEFLPLVIKNIPIIFSFLGIFFAITLNSFNRLINKNKKQNKNHNVLMIEFPQNFVNVI